MTVIRLLAPALLCAAVAAPVSADVTLQSKRTETSGEAGPIVINNTEYRTGTRPVPASTIVEWLVIAPEESVRMRPRSAFSPAAFIKVEARCCALFLIPRP